MIYQYKVEFCPLFFPVKHCFTGKKSGQNDFDHLQTSFFHFHKKVFNKAYKNKKFFMYLFLNLKKSKVYELNEAKTN
jgi:hypothetical protein